MSDQKNPNPQPKAHPPGAHPDKLGKPVLKTTAGLPGQTWTNVDAKETWAEIRRKYPKEFKGQGRRSFLVWFSGLFAVLRRVFHRGGSRS